MIIFLDLLRHILIWIIYLDYIDYSKKKISILNFWDTTHSFKKEDWESSPYNERDWERCQDLRNSENSPTVLRLKRGAKGIYYNKDDEGGSGDNIHILAPNRENS